MNHSSCVIKCFECIGQLVALFWVLLLDLFMQFQRSSMPLHCAKILLTVYSVNHHWHMYLLYWIILPLTKHIAFSSESMIENPSPVYYGCQMRNVFALLSQTSLYCWAWNLSRFFPVYVSYFNPVALCLDSSSINNNQIKENGFSWLQGITYYTKTPL